MRPLQELPWTASRQVRFVLCDIDDTLTDNGRLPSVAYAALEQLRITGYKVIPVTGRPAGWCDLIARQWPVDAVVGENGAFYFHYDESIHRMKRRFWHNADTRSRHRSSLEGLANRIIREVPGAAVAADQRYRETDLAIDYREDVEPLDVRAVRRIVDIFREEGAKAKISSIHVNGWFGENDKSTMSGIVLKEIFNYDLASQPEQSLFVGDSPNDCPMFAAAGLSIGVANIREFADQLNPPPHWITRNPGARGFAEVVDYLVTSQGGR